MNFGNSIYIAIIGALRSISMNMSHVPQLYACENCVNTINNAD